MIKTNIYYECKNAQEKLLEFDNVFSVSFKAYNKEFFLMSSKNGFLEQSGDIRENDEIFKTCDPDEIAEVLKLDLFHMLVYGKGKDQDSQTKIMDEI